MIWTLAEGWDKWEQLNAEVLPLPDQYHNASLLHVITEGGGGAEAGMVARYRQARGEGANVMVSIEPVIHQVDRARGCARPMPVSVPVPSWASSILGRCLCQNHLGLVSVPVPSWEPGVILCARWWSGVASALAFLAASAFVRSTSWRLYRRSSLECWCETLFVYSACRGKKSR
jgi:hypothetical protein